jgi:hypothetical protein
VRPAAGEEEGGSRAWISALEHRCGPSTTARPATSPSQDETAFGAGWFGGSLQISAKAHAGVRGSQTPAVARVISL